MVYSTDTRTRDKLCSCLETKMFQFRVCLVTTLLCALQVIGIGAQDAPHPPDYPGVGAHIPGVFVTPVAGAPFSGTVEIVSKEVLPDGSTRTRQTVNHIARNSAGTIYNERRQLVPPGYQGEPRLLSSHIYDPQTRVSTFLEPRTFLSRQTVLKQAPKNVENNAPQTLMPAVRTPNLTITDLGTETVAGLQLHGTRKERVVPASLSGTGKEITITDEYWLSTELNVYLIIRHNDPRTGEQTIGIVDVNRREPDSATFQIPAKYKVVDETPVEQP